MTDSLFDAPAAPFFGASTDDLLAGLNPPQREAVVHVGAPLLVVAGAGSGKTRVLTRRIAYLVAARGVHPASILAITFTNKAAAEMRTRVEETVGRRARLMWVSTFHSACVRILRAEINRFGWTRAFSIYDDADAKRLLARVVGDLDIDAKRFKPKQIRHWISDQKNNLIDFETAVSRNAEHPQHAVYADVYREYQRRLQQANALDFDDLIMTTVNLFQAFPDVREAYRRRFRHILVDEYQDTNHAQYSLVRELCSEAIGRGVGTIEPPELMVVGDSDQSIYAFRGATIENILDFDRDFPGARTIVLEQNYRSTQTVLSAANAVIQNNAGRPEKRLWTEAGDGPLIVGYVADTEHDEARFIATEITDLAEKKESRYGDTAVFYRTNAQSRTLEEAFIRVGVPYKVIGGVRFYERKEIRDAIAYLRAIANPADDVSAHRILNEPKRGIGATTQEVIDGFALQQGISFSQALERADEITGLSSRAIKPVTAFASMMAAHRAMVEAGEPADAVLVSILDASGLLEDLRHSDDPQDETRLENLAELASVAREFVAAAHTIDLPSDDDVDPDNDAILDDGFPEGALFTPPVTEGASADPGEGSGAADLADAMLVGAPEPDDSLPAFLERIALVADSDQIPDGEEKADVVTLMTLHTAKGLEFDTVFLTGVEDGLFPHERALTEPKELEEERRLAYVGITRSRNRLYVSRALVRTLWGAPSHNPASRFLSEIPSHLIDWRRLGGSTTWADEAVSGRVWGEERRGSGERRSSGSSGGSPTFSTRAPARRKTPAVAALAVGDRVLHEQFGLGEVVAVSGSESAPRADIDFGSSGVKRLSLAHAPLEKL
ncbi:MAG: UvrD-helicase domain-containing protein [Propionibacteriaceae bacterium]|jgi:DNA helicase-2/ATP-dependent DNA helicase PcrA|nr:UvrD-helicase domain-containing protein [Propionibacteriaceae bacterium]